MSRSRPTDAARRPELSLVRGEASRIAGPRAVAQPAPIRVPSPAAGPIERAPEVATQPHRRPPRLGISAEILHDGTWLELTARVASGRRVATCGYSLEDFGEHTLQRVAEWLTTEVERMDGRHLAIVRVAESSPEEGRPERPAPR